MATLLTGVGYIGAALLRRLAENGAPGAPIVALDNFYSTLRKQVEAALPPGTQLIEGDVADPDIVAYAFDQLGTARNERPMVFHLAAQPSAAMSARQPEVTERSNLVGARILLQMARDRGAAVVFGGSFRVYGDDLSGQNISEASPYGRQGDLSHLSKIYVEHLARTIDVPFISVRLGIAYGHSPIIKTAPEFMTAPNLFCQRAARGEALRVIDDRPLAFIHVQDAADALLAAATRLARTEARWEVANAAPEVATIGHVARTVQHLAQTHGVRVDIQGATLSEAGFSVTSRLDQEGFWPKRSLTEGLGEVLEFFLRSQ